MSAETKPTIELREGDVYHFSYSEAEQEKANRGWSGSLRHCFEGFVIVRNGKLCDTFWGLENSEARIVRAEQGELTFLCNLDDVRRIRRYEAIHYDAADVFRISEQHGCTEHFFVRKDAAVSSARILEEIRKKRHDVEDEMKRAVSSAASTLFQLGELQRAIEGGDLSRKPWW